MEQQVGYYICNDKVFSKKRDLFNEIRNNPTKSHNVRFWFNDVAYGKYNWKIEPEASLDELYRQRAQELRDKYSYLILMFSGGADSNQVLRSFIDNGIHLDEVRTSTLAMYEDVADQNLILDGYHIGRIKEFREAALPRLRKLALTHPQIKINILDVSNFVGEKCKSENFFADNRDLFAVYTDYWGLKGTYEVIKADETAEVKSGKVGVIYGNEKPYLFKLGSKLYTSFNDVSLNFALRNDNHNLLFDSISFYWAENPDIVCKQAHTFKKALKDNMNLRTLFNLGKFYTEHPLLEKIIYPSTYEPEYFQYEVKNRDDDILTCFYGNRFADMIMKEIRNPMNINVGRVAIREGMACRVQSKYYEIADLEQ